MRCFFCCFLAACTAGFLPVVAQRPGGPEVAVERFRRVSHREVHFWVKIANKGDQPVFLTGIRYETGPSLFPVYLDQWDPKEGWKSYFCLDMPSPHTIKLNPGEGMTEELWWKLPMSAVCKNPITKLEGKFRFRVEYFASEKEARAYVKKLFSPKWRDARAPMAVSESFEILPEPSPR
jgi:hypothetical protein